MKAETQSSRARWMQQRYCCVRLNEHSMAAPVLWQLQFDLIPQRFLIAAIQFLPFPRFRWSGNAAYLPATKKKEDETTQRFPSQTAAPRSYWL